MKTAQEWIQTEGWLGFTENRIEAIQLDAMTETAAYCVALLKNHWGHEIVRTVAKAIATRYGLPEPAEPFHVEHLHPPKATPSAVLQDPSAPRIEADFLPGAPAAGVLSPAFGHTPAPASSQISSLPPSPERPRPQSSAFCPTGQDSPAWAAPTDAVSELSKSPQPPPQPARQDERRQGEVLDYARAKGLADRLNAEWFERLGKLEQRLEALEKRVQGVESIEVAWALTLQERLEATKVEIAKHGERLAELERQMRVATEWLANLEQWKERLQPRLEKPEESVDYLERQYSNLVRQQPAPPGARPVSDSEEPPEPPAPAPTPAPPPHSQATQGLAPLRPAELFLIEKPYPGDYVDLRLLWDGYRWTAAVAHRWQKA